MRIFMGIDGGGSKTSCALGDEALLLGTATAAGSNIVRVGEAQARIALESAIAEACAKAGVEPRQITRTCVGTAGASVPQVRDAVRAIVTARVGGAVDIVGDMEIAQEAAFGGAPGVIVIAGTGSIAFARDAEGRTVRAGGWGYAISDEGSGHWIGKRAVGAILRARDSRCSCLLEEKVLQCWNIKALADLVKIANRVPPPDFAQLFPAVVAAATSGDELACRVLTEAGSELAQLAITAIRALWSDSQCVRVALVGGVFRHSAVVRQTFCGTLRRNRQKTAISFSVIEPVVGALALARHRGAQLL